MRRGWGETALAWYPTLIALGLAGVLWWTWTRPSGDGAALGLACGMTGILGLHGWRSWQTWQARQRWRRHQRRIVAPRQVTARERISRGLPPIEAIGGLIQDAEPPAWLEATHSEQVSLEVWSAAVDDALAVWRVAARQGYGIPPQHRHGMADGRQAHHPPTPAPQEPPTCTD
jgi:hypothetical protein